MKQILKKREKKGAFKIIIMALLVFGGIYNPVFATAQPVIDMTANSIPLVYQLLQDPPNFETRRSNDNTELWYGPLKISNDITGVNSIKMKFRATNVAGSPFVCPDEGTDGSWSNKFASVDLHKIDEVSVSYDQVYLNMGIDLPWIDPFLLASNSIKTYNGAYGGGTSLPDNYNKWRKNTDGTCSMYLTDNGTDLSTQIDSGWYILRLPGTSVDSSSTSSYNDYVNRENNDTQKISILGDNSYDTALVAQGISGSGSPFVITPNVLLNGWAPFVPSFPYMEFTYSAPPVIEKESSCNPFTGDITTAFLNTEFSLSSCLKQIAINLFVPTSGTTIQFTSLINEIKQKPPFGWGVGIYDLLTGLSIEEVEPIFILEEVEPITDNIFDPIRTGLSWLLYFAFAFYLFNRFKDINI